MFIDLEVVVARYVDGFLLPLPRKNVEEYRRMSARAGKVWRDHGALEYRECVGEDLKVKFGVPFTRPAKTKAGETVVFSWIVYKSRASRPRQREGDEGSPPQDDDGSEKDAVRRQADGIRWVRSDRGHVSSKETRAGTTSR
jgi:uncharacterized protein YbaA (DUF1428 family)